MPRSFLVPALSAAALSFATAALSANDDFNRGRPEAGAQGTQLQSSQTLSGSGDVRQNRQGAAPGERSGDAISSQPEARFSSKSAEAERLIDNPEKRDIPAAPERGGTVRPEASVSGNGPTPGPAVKDRSSEVQ